MLQGRRQSLLCTYVFEELPKMYKLVCERNPKELQIKYRKKKTPVKPHVKCEQCKFTSSMIQMKMHIKTVHSTKPNFTPMLKPSKK